MIKMFSEDLGFVAETNKDIFAILVRNEKESVNCFLCDEEVKELQMLCEYHLQNKGVNE
jgi:hypothetical protein